MIESVIKKATKKENLTYEEARMTMTELMNGTATPIQASAYLVSMAMVLIRSIFRRPPRLLLHQQAFLLQSTAIVLRHQNQVRLIVWKHWGPR